MIQSMTGFATKTITLDINGQPVDLTFTIKTLNSRYFEASCKMPSACSALEVPIIGLLKKNLMRGKTYFNITTNKANAFDAASEPSLATIKGYLDAVDQIKKTYNIEGSISIADIIQLPHVFQSSEVGLDKKDEKTILTAVKELIKELVAERIKEGKNLEIDLLNRSTTMLSLIEAIEKRTTIVLEERKKLLTHEIDKADISEEIRDDLKRQRIYIDLDRLDIHEEIIRFKSHLQNFLDIINSDKPQSGKQLDFTLQELFRETNTIASKASDPQISTDAISIKVELEKAREMGQNIV